MHPSAVSLLGDVETGGFSIEKNPILEIGYAFMDAEHNILEADVIPILPPEGTVLRLSRDQVIPEGTWIIEKEAADINGYHEAIWEERGAVSLKEAQHRLWNAVGKFRGPFYGHNVSTEKRWIGQHFPNVAQLVTEWRCSMAMLRQYCKANGITTIGTRDDPVTGAKIPGTLTLAGGCKLAGVVARGAHGAFEDCVATSALLKFLDKPNKQLAS